MPATRRAVLARWEEVENAPDGVRPGRERVDARRAGGCSAREAASLLRKLYQAGLTDFRRCSKPSAPGSLPKTTWPPGRSGDAEFNLIKLYKALGGGWCWPDAGAPEGRAAP